MNIYDYAMKMEKDGEDHYRELGRSCKIIGLQKILTMLADEELKHYRVIEQLRRRAENPQMTETAVLENVKNIFVRMREEKADIQFDASDAEVYRRARDIEEMSRKFYLDKAGAVEGEAARQLFLRLAREEEKHLRIMENIVEFVARPEPGNWLENTEWYHLDEY